MFHRAVNSDILGAVRGMSNNIEKPGQFINSLSHQELVSRKYPRNEDLRGYYFRDTTAIIHSYPFRRLKNKTQVFFSPKNDHICTRIEHVMHVATISAAICRALGLDADLAWAISLGHDLGHTPFGHLGEQIIEKIRPGGRGFAHEIYSLRVVDHLIGYGRGLNLTYAVRDGIVNHCGEKFEQQARPDFRKKDLESIDRRDRYPSTWEGIVVRMSDKIAYLGRDLEDAIQLKLITKEMIPDRAAVTLGRSNSEIIDSLVRDLTTWSPEHGAIGFSEEAYKAIIELKEFNYREIYNNPLLSNYHEYFERILGTLYGYLDLIFHRHEFDIEGYKSENNMLAVRFGDYLMKMKNFYESVDRGFHNLVLDYVAGMTDDFAIDCITEIMIPMKFETQFDDLLLG